MFSASRFFRAITGQDIIEYALVCMFISVAVVAFTPGVSDVVNHLFQVVICNMQDGKIDYTDATGKYTCILPTPHGGRK